MEHITKKKFPRNFLWGSASAAYQVEGAADTDGKGPSIWDIYVQKPGVTFKGTTGALAVDHYHRFKEDVALMAEMGLKTYRFSVSWSRIFPNGTGEPNEAGVRFYEELIDELIAHNIEPMLTLYHWDLPNALQEAYGGWESRQILPDFLAYATFLFERFRGKVNYWVSLNEQNIFMNFGYFENRHPPSVSNEKRFYAANHIANLANALVIAKFHEMNMPGQIGPSFAYGPAYPLDCHPANILAADNAEDYLSHFWMDVYMWGEYPPAIYKWLEERGVAPLILPEDTEILKNGKPDFMGVNYYQTNTVAINPLDGVGAGAMNTSGEKGTETESGVPGLFKKVSNPFLERTNWDWAIDPEGLRIGLRRIDSRYHIPVLITENGLGEYDTLEADGCIHDPYRIDYLTQHVRAVEEAIQDGVNVLGYCTWSFTDLLSWLNGYQKRYGFVYVRRDETDEGDLARFKKDSFYWFQNVIATNGASVESGDSYE